MNLYYKSFLLFICLTSICSTSISNIVIYRAGDTLAEFKSQLSWINNNWQSSWGGIGGNFTSLSAQGTWFGKKETISVENININNVIINPSQLTNYTILAGTNTIRYYANELFYFEFGFNYKYSCFRSGSGIGYATAIARGLVIDISYPSDYERSVDIEIGELAIQKTMVPAGDFPGDTEVARLAKKAFEGFQDIRILQALVNYNFGASLNSLDFNSRMVLETYYPNLSFNIRLYETKAPKIIKDGLVNYRAGRVENSDYNNTILTEWSDFDPNLSDFQLFFHQNFLDQIYSVHTDREFKITVTPDKLPSGLKFDLSVKSLKQFLSKS